MISVIVPFYNCENYLQNCIESVINQSYSEIEVICIDDGSTDSSSNLIRNLMKKDTRIKLYSQENKGRSAARNFGISVAQGDYICFVDADDIIPNNSLELLHGSIYSDGSDASIGSIHVEYDIHEELRESDLAYYTVNRSGPYKISDHLISSFHSSACACLFKKEIIDKFKLKFPEGLNYEDAYWHWCYFSLCNFISFVKETVYIYIRRPDSVMSRTFEIKSNLAVEHIYIVDRIYDFLKSNNLVKGREQTLLNLVEQYFWLSIKYSKKYEIPLIAYSCSILLRKMNFNLNKYETLKSIYHGDLEFLYNKSHPELNNADLVAFLRMKSLINTLLPKISF